MRVLYFSVAIQAWSFATHLPLFIGDLVPVDNPMWECYLVLLQVCKVCTVKVVTIAATRYLSALIDQHHREFKRCYPSTNFTPKMHYMVHFPSDMLR